MKITTVTASKLAACLLGLAWAAPASAGTPAEFFNEYDWAPTSPTPGPTDFEIIFAGNVSCQIPPQNAHDGSTNPFKGGKPITTTFDPTSNTTTVEFSGAPLVPGQRYHFGLNQGFAPTPPLQVIGKKWTYRRSAPSPLPIVNVTPTTPIAPKGPYKYAIVYLEAAFEQGGQTYGSWYEIPYNPNKTSTDATTGQPMLTFTNYGKQTLYISNTGIQFGVDIASSPECVTNPTCSANNRRLNRLDFGITPPPGQPNTKFVAIAAPPPAKLTPTPVATPVTACKSTTKPN